MNTQRNIMLITLGVMLAGVASAVLLIWWLGLLSGALAFTALIVVLLAAYLLVIRPWHLTWGATAAEIAAALPGDDLVPGGVVSTRAVTIRGRAREVWPWLVQIGFGRAGWYSYDWIDNDGEPSADSIMPELQDLKVGDQIEIIPDMGPTVVSIDAERSLLCAAEDRSSSWCLFLDEDGDTTRLVSRWRNDFEVTPATAVIVALTDPGAFVMEQKMLRTIRERVESQRVGGL